MYLDEIVSATRERVAMAKRLRPLSDLGGESAGPPRQFRDAIDAEDISLIAEFKRKSPSKGDIRPGAEPASIAGAYERGGARALSVLTEPRFFDGSDDDLTKAHEATNLPVLRKDFIVDPYQVAEARAIGADAVLLIIAALGDRSLYRDLFAMTTEMGLTPLVEVHDMYELERAFDVEPSVIGINQRNLATFEVDMQLAMKMRKEVPEGICVVAESGIESRGQVINMEQSGISAILVGESLMRADDPELAARTLLGTAPD